MVGNTGNITKDREGKMTRTLWEWVMVYLNKLLMRNILSEKPPNIPLQIKDLIMGMEVLKDLIEVESCF
jgi:hypothetical protein